VIVLVACGYTYLWQGFADVNRVGEVFLKFFLGLHNARRINSIGRPLKQKERRWCASLF